MKKNECVHKEIYLGRWIITDENGVIFEMCGNCWRRLRHLKGFKIVESGIPVPLTERQKKMNLVRISKPWLG